MKTLISFWKYKPTGQVPMLFIPPIRESGIKNHSVTIMFPTTLSGSSFSDCTESSTIHYPKSCFLWPLHYHCWNCPYSQIFSQNLPHSLSTISCSVTICTLNFHCPNQSYDGLFFFFFLSQFYKPILSQKCSRRHEVQLPLSASMNLFIHSPYSHLSG